MNKAKSNVSVDWGHQQTELRAQSVSKAGNSKTGTRSSYQSSERGTIGLEIEDVGNKTTEKEEHFEYKMCWWR